MRRVRRFNCSPVDMLFLAWIGMACSGEISSSGGSSVEGSGAMPSPAAGGAASVVMPDMPAAGGSDVSPPVAVDPGNVDTPPLPDPGGDMSQGGSGGMTTDDGSGGSMVDTPPAPEGQGPSAEGTIVFSQDFEEGMDGVTRSPTSLPEDRALIVDDPIGERGKVVKVEFREGDNFRTSSGTSPRSWISSARGYRLESNTRISVAWGMMFTDTQGASYAFAQIIRSGGPLWMFHINSNGTMRISVNRGSGGANNILTFEPNKWYDFRVETDYRSGGEIQFFANGEMVATGTGDGGASDGRWDGGIYWQRSPYSDRTVYVSNISIGEK